MQSEFVNKKPAKTNDNIELGETTVLHSSSQQEITITPFFIKHSTPEKERDLSIKLEQKRKSHGVALPGAEINLNEGAVIRLRDKLNELLSLKKIPENGNFLLVRLGDSQNVDLSGLDSTDVAKALISVLENDDIITHIDAIDFSDDLAFAFRHSIRIKSLIKAMNELESALDTTNDEHY